MSDLASQIAVVQGKFLWIQLTLGLDKCFALKRFFTLAGFNIAMQLFGVRFLRYVKAAVSGLFRNVESQLNGPLAVTSWHCRTSYTQYSPN